MNSGSTLSLEGATTYSGGTFGGAGVLSQDADAVVESDTTIGVSTFDPSVASVILLDQEVDRCARWLLWVRLEHVWANHPTWISRPTGFLQDLSEA